MADLNGREPALPSPARQTGREPELGGARSLRPPEGALVMRCPMCRVRFGVVVDWRAPSAMRCPSCRYTFPVLPGPDSAGLTFGPGAPLGAD